MTATERITGSTGMGMPRKARIADVVSVQRLINEHADTGKMLARSLSELYENLRDFSVVVERGAVVGCCALHISWDDLAEVRSLAVDPSHQGKGIGKALVAACISEARQLGLRRVFALTREPAFFERAGFTVTTVEQMPRKVWGDCIHCPRFPECDEVAVMMDL